LFSDPVFSLVNHILSKIIDDAKRCEFFGHIEGRLRNSKNEKEIYMYKKMTRPLQFLSVLGLLIAGNALMNHQCQAISKQISQNICMCGISAGYKLGCNESGTGCGVIPDSPTP
jgi:hypothetical protein